MNRAIQSVAMLLTIGALSLPVASFAEEAVANPGGEWIDQFKQRTQDRREQIYENASDEQKAGIDARREQWQGMSQDERRTAYRDNRLQHDRGRPGPGVRPFDYDPGVGRGRPGRGWR
jgi:hypothetical protein